MVGAAVKFLPELVGQDVEPAGFLMVPVEGPLVADIRNEQQHGGEADGQADDVDRGRELPPPHGPERVDKMLLKEHGYSSLNRGSFPVIVSALRDQGQLGHFFKPQKYVE
jgi:hypothetical protein